MDSVTNTLNSSSEPASIANSRFLRACRREPVDATPVWLMRQAGRYMPQYRALRERYGILDLIKDPDLATEVTLQPVNAFAVDAAIIFADILPLLSGMGLSLEFVKGEGPLIHHPVRSSSDIDRLVVRPAAETLPSTLEAIRQTKRELAPRGLPLIGFSGAPFTLACYAIEGGPSRHHDRVKALMMSEPVLWDRLMTKLADAAGEYLVAQAEAGANALQVFDSWVGELSPSDHRQYVLPYTSQVVSRAKATGVPVILFGVNTGGLLEDMASTGADVIGVDWRIDLDVAFSRLPNHAVQGNLDPITLLASWDALDVRTRNVLHRAGGRPGHIFNLGHGVLPKTPVENVRRLVELVHEVTGSP